jgi:hypothetical protein
LIRAPAITRRTHPTKVGCNNAASSAADDALIIPFRRDDRNAAFNRVRRFHFAGDQAARCRWMVVEVRGSKPNPFAILLRNLNGNTGMFTTGLTRFGLSLSQIVAGCPKAMEDLQEFPLQSFGWIITVGTTGQ